jgi:hypothetical protein
MLCFVERKSMGRLGVDTSAPMVESRRGAQEKKPWKDLPGIESKVEREFLRPVLLGESILPYRVFQPFEAVMPVTSRGDLLDSAGAANRGFDGLSRWMRRAEERWSGDVSDKSMTIVERWNFHGELIAQFPIKPLRVVYAKAGMKAAACIIEDASQVVDHKLYWFAPSSKHEAYYLIAIINSETVRSRSESRQSRGQWGARDFDKVAFNLPIPRFDQGEKLHIGLAAAAEKAEKIAASVPLPDGVKFQKARALVRAALAEAGIAAEIDTLVARLLDGG